MGKLGCSASGYLANSRFSEPIPWIGLYVAAASSACALAMAVDVFHAIRFRKFWFPCKFFSLNATTLTLITVATKLSVDLNTEMPRRQDQLAKLSSAALICTVMGNFLPSLGSMENRELLMNIIALGIVVITVIANTCIQLVTGVIYMFCNEHIAVMILMFVLLMILISSALTVPTTKSYFDKKYREKYEEEMKECNYRPYACKNMKLRDDLTRFWMMAHTCSPQFVVGRLVTCTASCSVCLLSTVVLAQAALWGYLRPRSFKFCHGESDYKWSSTLILVTQFVAIGVGSIAPTFRWFNTVNFRCPKKAVAWKVDFKVESYWIKRLSLWREHPLILGYGRRWKMLVENMKDRFLGFCIWMQIALVLLSKLIWLISIYLMSFFLVTFHFCKGLFKWLKCKTPGPVHGTDGSFHIREANLEHYVLHLEGEENFIDVMMKRNYDATDQWIAMGRKKQPKHLLLLLEQMPPSASFDAVWAFDSDQVPSLEFPEPPNCWSLPVVTLSTIAIAISNIDFHFDKDLLRSIKEGLNLIRNVEENVETRELINIRKAADMAWLGVDLKCKWLGVDLRKMARHRSCAEEVLKELADMAERKVKESLSNGDSRETPWKWPIHVLAANSMYRICSTLLLIPGSRASNQALIERLSSMIIDIIGACLSNLRLAISKQCERGTIEEREELVRSAIALIGKTKNLLGILDKHTPPILEPDRLAYIDDWRAMRKV